MFFLFNSHTPRKVANTGAEKCQKMLRAVGEVALLVWLCVHASAVHADKDTLYDFDIPGQDLLKSIHEISNDTQTLILFPYKLVESRQGSSVEGQYTALDALNITLQKTGFVGIRSKTNALTISKSMFSKKNSLREGEMNYRKNILVTAIGALIGAGGAPHLLAQEDAKLISESEQLIEELLVVGTAASDRNSTEMKKNSDFMMDVMAADEIGSLPDRNVAEVFSRIPGISTISSNVQDEGSIVVIRGYATNPVTFDGLGVVVPQSRRQTNLEAIPSSAIVTAEVNKSMTASRSGEGLTGSINMTSRSAFSTDGMFLRFDTEQQKYSLDDSPMSDVGVAPKYGVTFSNTFGDSDQFGVVFAAEYSERHSEGSKFETGWIWSDVTEAENLDHYNWKRVTEDQVNQYERVGGILKLEYQGDDYSAFLSAYHFNKDEQLDFNRYELGRVGSKAEHGENGYAYYPIGWETLQYRREDIDRSSNRLHFHVDGELTDNQSLSFDMAYGDGSRKREHFYPIFVTPGLEGLAWETISRDEFNIFDPDQVGNIDNFYLREDHHSFHNYDAELFESKVDWSLSLDRDDYSLALGAGLQYSNNKLERDDQANGYKVIGGEGSSVFLNESAADYGYTPNGFVYVTPYLDIDQYLSLRDGYIANDLYKYSDSDLAQRDLKDDYIFEEEIIAAYFQANYATEKWTVIAGLRVEKTDVVSDGWRRDKNEEGGYGQYFEYQNENDYTTILPSLNVMYRINEDWRIRAAVSKSIGRPLPNNVRAGGDIDYCATDLEPTYQCSSSQGDYDIRINQYNANLDPEESLNTEISLEYYFENGMAALAVFKKEIDNGPVSITHIQENDPEFGGLSVRYSEKTNADAKEISGIEFSYKQDHFGFLPELFAGLGVGTNITLLSGEIAYTDYKEESFAWSDLEYQPDRIVNAHVYYSFLEGLGEVKLAYQYTGQTRHDRDNSNEYKSDFVQPKEEFDLSVRYQFNDNIGANFQVRNIFDEKTIRATGYGRDLTEYEFNYGRTYSLGLSYQY